jgi:hypothetical protein
MSDFPTYGKLFFKGLVAGCHSFCLFFIFFMHRRPILCTGTLYGAVDFLNVLKKGCLWGVVLLVHSEIYYVPIGDGWEEKYWYVIHYVPVLHPGHKH